MYTSNRKARKRGDRLKKVIKIICVVITIVISNFAILANTVKALEISEFELYTKGNLSRILKYDGMLIKTAYVVYKHNEEEYPAYCLNVELKGVGEDIAYNTINQGKITDVGLWRVIINGYPYKSLEELQVFNVEEAYIATKQSIYCYLYNRGTEKYSGVGEAGERTLNAMNIILENAKKSTETLGTQEVKIEEESEWEIDQIDENYMSKTYKVSSNININKYNISLENTPEDVIVTDKEDQIKTEFQEKEFKILIPINLKESIKFKINITAQMETKPVFYGKAPSENLQNYALTAFCYEDIQGELNQEYSKIEEPPPEPEEPLIEKPEEPEKVVEYPIIEEVKKLPVTGM